MAQIWMQILFKVAQFWMPFNSQLELMYEGQALPFKTFERHQHLSVSRVADDKLLNARVDEVLQKESKRLRKLQALVASQNVQRHLNPIVAGNYALARTKPAPDPAHRG